MPTQRIRSGFRALDRTRLAYSEILAHERVEITTGPSGAHVYIDCVAYPDCSAFGDFFGSVGAGTPVVVAMPLTTSTRS
jgi:hypothetical protein